MSDEPMRNYIYVDEDAANELSRLNKLRRSYLPRIEVRAHPRRGTRGVREHIRRANGFAKSAEEDRRIAAESRQLGLTTEAERFDTSAAMKELAAARIYGLPEVRAELHDGNSPEAREFRRRNHWSPPARDTPAHYTDG